MITPNKFTTLDRSLLAKVPKILVSLNDEPSLEELYGEIADSFEDPGEFILALDVLFVLGRVTIDHEKKAVILC